MTHRPSCRATPEPFAAACPSSGDFGTTPVDKNTVCLQVLVDGSLEWGSSKFTIATDTVWFLLGRPLPFLHLHHKPKHDLSTAIHRTLCGGPAKIPTQTLPFFITNFFVRDDRSYLASFLKCNLRIDCFPLKMNSSHLKDRMTANLFKKHLLTSAQGNRKCPLHTL